MRDAHAQTTSDATRKANGQGDIIRNESGLWRDAWKDT